SPPAADPNASDAPYDDLAVGSPFPVLGTTEEGRSVLRLYYAARDRATNAVIGLAARFGSDGPFVRATSPVFGTGSTQDPHAPSVLSANGYALLYVTQKQGKTANTAYPVIAVGVAPALLTLPPPNPM